MESLKEARLRMGLTQVKMAQRCGVSLGTYRLWEYGENQSADNRKRLDAVLAELNEASKK